MHQDHEIERVVEAYSDSLLRLAVHHVSDMAAAQDIVQDVFLTYMKQAPSFHDTAHERAWLFRVAINRCKNYRGHWWQSRRSIMPSELKDNEKTDFYVLDEVKKLPFHQKNAIYLFYFEELSIKQIAAIFNVKENTVASWLHRGREKLKVQLKGVWMHEA